jgi:hypothetical protein
MMSLFSNTPRMQRDNGATRLVYWVLCGLIAAAMGLAASASGNPATPEPLTDWMNIGANLICLVIAALVLPFNLVTIALAVIVGWHHRGDFGRGAGSGSSQ